MTAEAQSLWNNATVPEERTPEAVAARSLRAFEGQLEPLSEQIPEIAENKEAITEAANTIIAYYELQPTLFEEGGRSVVFAAIANRWAANSDETDPEKSKAEQTFLSDSLALLAYQHSPKLGGLRDEILLNTSSVEPKKEERIYEKYTDKQLSAEMRLAIDNGMLDNVKKELGITPENEDPYQIRVLSIDPHGGNAIGISAKSTPWDEIPGDIAEKTRVNDDEYAMQQNVKKYKEDLEQRAKDMAHEMGIEDSFGMAWVTELGENKVKTLCIAMPMAEKLLYPEVTENNRYYDAKAKAVDRALLGHEYTHTQGGLHIDHEPWIGVNIEEIRAENFSGNMMGYQDVKALFTDIYVASGFSIYGTIAGKVKGGTQTEVYSEIANKLGLNTMLEVLLAAPNAYLVSQGNRFQEETLDYLGNYDGIIGRILETERQRGNQADIAARVTERAKKIAEVEKDFDGLGSTILNFRRKHGLRVVTDLVEEELQQLKKAA